MKNIFRKLSLLAIWLLLFITVDAQKVYMKVEGSKSGIIKDQGMPSKFADRIELTGYSFESSSPREMGSGMAVGRRQKAPLTITKNNGSSSILLFSAQITNEVLKTVVLEIYRTNNVGMEVLEQTITLSNASISYFKQKFDNTPANGETKGPEDEIRFTYQTINITWVNGSFVAEDNSGGNN
jgi:type VI secretion system Hcp family effector